jgi:hypothetical protein
MIGAMNSKRHASTATAWPARGRSMATRIFLTVWLVYAVHFASNVVRESYLAMSLGDRISIRVDEYLGLHPDLFEIEGRGSFINSNPGASMLGAIPYALTRPLIGMVLRSNPDLTAAKPPTTYNDPRPNRTNFLNEARRRGLDVKLGLAAASMQVGLMAPAGALAAAVLFLFLYRRTGDSRTALPFALLYAFGTPIFFRSAFLNQNALVAHFVLFAYVIMAWPDDARKEMSPDGRRLAMAGALMGLALLCDYSAIPLLAVFAAWSAGRGWKEGGSLRSSMASAAAFALGAAGPVALLLAYQWYAFGNPLYPAQHYMPETPFSGSGWNGISLPVPELMWRNLLDPRYGLFVFCPMLLLAFMAPFVRRRPGDPSAIELAVIFAGFTGLYLFSSGNNYAFLQWNTGVRYLVPAVPLLFVALVPVLQRLRASVALVVAILTAAISWSVAMVREDVPTSIAHIFLSGFELPWLTVLRKTASAYAPFLQQGVSPVAVFCLAGALIWVIWRKAGRAETTLR